jgi:tetratricopeptide (TPR) repeat protein
METERLEQAEATFEEALTLVPSVSDVHLDLQHLLGLVEVARGRLTQSGVRLRAIEDGVLDREFASHVRRFYHLGGEILLARGRVDDALRNLEPTRGIYDHPLYRASLARAYEKAGRPADAERELRQILQMRDARLDVPIHYVKAHFALARLAATAGRRQEADELDRTFLTFWGDADAPLPSIADAKAKVRQ